MPRVPLKI